MNRRNALLFIMMAVSVGMVQAQVREFNIGAANNSIIRTVDDENVLIYTQPTADSGLFILYGRSDSTALAFSTPNKWEVHDVRIHNGTDAYFCGGQGLIGMFNIASMFAGTGTLHYAFCTWTENQYVLPTDLRRLDLFEDGPLVCMAMTGNTIWHINHMLPNTTVMSAYFNGSGMWKYSCFCNKDRYLTFTDVACLDDVIVAVGTNLKGDSCYMKTFNPVWNFPTQAIDVIRMVSVDYGKPKGDVLAVHRKDNIIVLAQYNDNPTNRTVFYETALSPLTGRPTAAIIDAWQAAPPSLLPFSGAWRMRELNWQGECAWLLQDAEYSTLVGGITDWLLQVPLTPIMGTAKLWNPTQCVAQSMDMSPSIQQPWLSGRNNRLTIYEPQWQINDNECYHYGIWDFNAVPALWHVSRIDDGEDGNSIPDFSTTRPVFQLRVTFVCD